MRDLPKVELHLHLEGAAPPSFVRGLAADVARRGAAIETHTEVLGVEWSRRGPVRVRTTRGDFSADEVVLATGIKPRTPNIEGIDHPMVLSYVDVLALGKPVGKRVAVIGAGGIGFDVAEFLSHEGPSTSQDIEAFMSEWGVDMTLQHRGGIEGMQARVPHASREVFLLQRKSSKVGAGLGKTTGWIHRAGLKNRGVVMMPGCSYQKIDDRGLHMSVGGEPQILQVDNIVICAGQEPLRTLVDGLKKAHHLIGGADIAKELDAKRAIDQGTRLAAEL